MGRRSRGRIRGAFMGMAVLGLFPGTGLGSDWKHLGADLNFWSQEGRGVLRGDLSATTGTPISLESDLNIDTDVGLADGRVWLGLGGTHLVVSFFQTEYEGRSTLQRDLTFHGQTFSQSEDVDSAIDNTVLGVYYYQSILPLKVVDVGFQVGVDVLDLNAVLESQTSGRESISSTVPLPAAGFHVGIQPVPKFRIYADVSVLSASIGGEDFDLTDGRAQVEIRLTRYIGLHGGYRLFDINVESDEFGSLDYTQEGPFLGMAVRF